MIRSLIENYKELTVVGVFAIMMAWYLWHQTRAQSKREDKRDKQQDEDREFHRNLITNDLKALHDSSLLNAKLNRKSIFMLKRLTEYFNKYFNNKNEKINFKKVNKANGRK